jgi:hypothetical protein
MSHHHKVGRRRFLKETRFRRAPVAPLYTVLLLVLLNSACYRRSEFKGGLGIRDNGVFSYPRYRAEVGRFPLSNGEYSFKITGLPAQRLMLTLQVENGMEAQRTHLASIPAHVTVTIAEASGLMVCKADGYLAESNGVADHKWILAGSASEAYYWNSDCQDIAIHRRRTYDVTVHISETDHSTPADEVTLVLAGGGIELP